MKKSHKNVQGFRCAEYWRCENSTAVMSDGSGLINLRQSHRPDSQTCVTMDDVTLDASDEKCPVENQVCCKDPDFTVKKCPPGGKTSNQKGV